MLITYVQKTGCSIDFLKLKYMTLYEFNILTLEEKLATIWKEDTLLKLLE